MNNKKEINTKLLLILALIVMLAATLISGCNAAEGSGGESGETGHSEMGGEESGTLLTLDQTYDVVRYGARLIMSYDKPSNSFIGTVENTTSSTLKSVRVEVHLSNGTELGPTTPTDLAPGEIMNVSIPATNQAFDGWTPHAEVGSSEGEQGEHGGGGEGQHDNGGEGEHQEGGEGGGG